jgi:hypothetical protein
VQDQDAVTTLSSTLNIDGTETVVVADLSPASSFANRFLRVRINRIIASTNSYGIPDDYLLATYGTADAAAADLAAATLDTSGSGLPVWWEMSFFGHTGVDPGGSSATSGVTNAQAYQQGIDPSVDASGGNPAVQLSTQEQPPSTPVVTVTPVTRPTAPGGSTVVTDLRVDWTYSGDPLTAFDVEWRDDLTDWTLLQHVSAAVMTATDPVGWETTAFFPPEIRQYRVRAVKSDLAWNVSDPVSFGAPIIDVSYDMYANMPDGRVTDGSMSAGSAVISGPFTFSPAGASSQTDAKYGKAYPATVSISNLFGAASISSNVRMIADPSSLTFNEDVTNFSTVNVSGNVYVLPAQVRVFTTGAGGSLQEAPDDGLLVLAGTAIVLRTTDLDWNVSQLPDANVIWKVRSMITPTAITDDVKINGAYSDWTQVGTGNQYSWTPSGGGVFEIEAVAFGTTIVFTRKHAAAFADPTSHACDAGKPQAVGVCDSQWQIDLRNEAAGWLGATNYDFNQAYPPFGKETYKCNLFVAHRIRHAGLTVPWLNGSIWRPAHPYPPTANQWGGADPTVLADIGGPSLVPSYVIQHWSSPSSAPQPGLIASHPHHGGSGHVGVVDYDGWPIGAGTNTVNKRNSLHNTTGGATWSWWDGTTVYRMYLGQ